MGETKNSEKKNDEETTLKTENYRLLSVGSG
jgi:hypothetical protein